MHLAFGMTTHIFSVLGCHTCCISSFGLGIAPELLYTMKQVKESFKVRVNAHKKWGESPAKKYRAKFLGLHYLSPSHSPMWVIAEIVVVPSS